MTYEPAGCPVLPGAPRSRPRGRPLPRFTLPAADPHQTRIRYPDLSLAALGDLFQARPEAQSAVYACVVDTVVLTGEGLKQTGHSPNWDGGLLTLCTGKAKMRAGRAAAEWPGQWIAGFTCRAAPFGTHTLVYLLRVGAAYPSYFDLWQALPPEVRELKAAHRNRRGDVFEPIVEKMKDPAARYDPRWYVPPVTDHSHAAADPKNPPAPRWHRDIDWQYNGKRPPYLVGDPDFSFLWSRPALGLDGIALTQGSKKWPTLIEMLALLKENDER